MTGTAQSAPPFGGAAFVKDPEAAQYLGLSVRSVRYLVADGKLKRVYPRERSARITVESLLSYREAIEAGRPPRIWTQPGNLHTAAPTPEAQPQKRGGLLARWGLGGGA